MKSLKTIWNQTRTEDDLGEDDEEEEETWQVIQS